jgi:hypothetical protein
MAEDDMLQKWIAGAQKIKLPGGVVGKVSLVLVVALIAVAVICAKAPIWWISVVGLVVIVGVLLVAWKLIAFAEKHPHAALLEGAELLIWQSREMAQKGKGVLTDLGNPTEPRETIALKEEEIKRLNVPDQPPPELEG